MKGIVLNRCYVDSKPCVRDTKNVPVIIEGSDLYDKIAPVSELTGKRENVVTVLSRLAHNPEYSRAINALLQEIPTIKSDPRLNDDDRIDLMMKRLSTGTPAEDDAVRSYLESVSDVLFKGAPQKVVDAVKENQIGFEPSDANVEDA